MFVFFVLCERTITTQLQWLSPGLDSRKSQCLANHISQNVKMPFFFTRWHFLNFLSLQVQRSVRTWQEASAHLWLFSATNYLMNLVSRLHRDVKKKEKKTKQNKLFSHYTVDTALSIHSTSWTKLLCEGLRRVTHIMTTSTASHAKQLLLLLEPKL